MTIIQLYYLITIAEQGSISAVARVLYVGQPTLTSAIKELEKELKKKDKELQDEKEKVEILKKSLHIFMQPRD